MAIETRVDPETGDWRLVAPGRAARPNDSDSRAEKVCPFCPGNEHLTPPERMRVPDGAPDWRIRVVPNKYPVVDPSQPTSAVPAVDHRPVFPATGEHEVVIESPQHDWDIREADLGQATEILFALRRRVRALEAHRPVVLAFRNYGRAAGASLSHPHSQIVALDRVPPALEDKWQHARRHHAATGRRLLDDIAAAERADAVRVVADHENLLVFQPHASVFAHHTTLLPADGAATLAAAADSAVIAVARVLPAVLTGLAGLLDDPAYNFVVHSGPANERDAGRWYQWHLSIYPRTGTLGGLELGTGLAVNPTAPEATAPMLRDALARASVDP